MELLMDANVFVHSALINNGSLLPYDMVCARFSSLLYSPQATG